MTGMPGEVRSPNPVAPAQAGAQLTSQHTHRQRENERPVGPLPPQGRRLEGGARLSGRRSDLLHGQKVGESGHILG